MPADARHGTGGVPSVGRRGLTVLPSEKRLVGLNFGVQRVSGHGLRDRHRVTDEVVSAACWSCVRRPIWRLPRPCFEWLGRRGAGGWCAVRCRAAGCALSWEQRKSSMVGLGTNILS